MVRGRRWLAVVIVVLVTVLLGVGRVGPAAADTVVRLGGSVTDTAGIPVEGVQVSFSGGGASTAADGSWSMYLVPNSGGMLTFMFPGQPFGVSDNYSIGTADRTIDLTEPTMTTAVFTVTDANANPLIGLTVHNGAGNANAPLSDGTILQAVYMPMNADATCTTDSAGSCTVPALTGSQPSFYTDYVPGPGQPTFTAGNNSVPMQATPTAVSIVFAPFDTVRLGGSVTDTAGIPVEGVQVSFSGGSASTAADGSWSMYLVPNSGGMLTFMFPGQPFGVSDNYSIGTADRTIDLTEPTMTTAVFTVTDANANPLIGLTVHNGAGNANAPLSDGTILQAVYMPMNADADLHD